MSSINTKKLSNILGASAPAVFFPGGNTKGEYIPLILLFLFFLLFLFLFLLFFLLLLLLLLLLLGIFGIHLYTAEHIRVHLYAAAAEGFTA